MRVHTKVIPYSKDGEKFYLIAQGDQHRGHINCEAGRIEEMYREWGDNKNALFIDMGDACDCIVSADSKRFRPAEVHPDLLWDGDRPREDWVDIEIDWYCEPVEKYIKKATHLGIVSGNHPDAIAKRYGTDPTRRIAERLGIPNLGYSFGYNLYFELRGKKKKLVIFGHHGLGTGARSFGAPVSALCTDALARTGTDICLYGHTHCKWSYPIIRPVFKNLKLHEERAIVANTGAFMKTYGDYETPTYSEVKAYPMRDLGYVVIEITTPTDTDGFRLRGTV